MPSFSAQHCQPPIRPTQTKKKKSNRANNREKQTKTQQKTTLVHNHGILWLNPAIFLLSDIKVPVHSPGREGIESGGFLAPPYLILDLWTSFYKPRNPVFAQRFGVASRLQEFLYTGLNLPMRRTVFLRLLTQYLGNKPIFLMPGNKPVRLMLVLRSRTAFNSA